MYRAYQPTLPTANLYLQEKWDKNRYEEHRRKVSMAVPVVDTKACQMPAHLLVNMKRIQMDRDLQAVIEKQNCIHSAKISAIHQSHGLLDNWNLYTQRSLNTGQRRQHLFKITQENGKILERILKRQSEYGRWVSEWEKVAQVRTNISRYQRPTGSAWAGWQKATSMDKRKNMDIQHLAKENEIDKAQMGSTLQNEGITLVAEHRRVKESPALKNRKGQFPLLHTETFTDTPSWESARCNTGQRSAGSLYKRKASNSAIPEKTCQVRCKPRSQKPSYSECYCNNFKDVSPGRSSLMKEEFDGKSSMKEKSFYKHNRDKTEYKENCERADEASNKYADSEAFDSVLEKKAPVSYSKSDLDFSSGKSDTSSCYSLQDSEDGFSSTPLQSPEITETLSNLNLNIKTRSVSPGTTSQRSSKSSVAPANQLESPCSMSHNAIRDSNHSLNISKRRHFRLSESTKTSTGSSSQMTYKRADSTSRVTNRIETFIEGASMRASSRSPASSTHRQCSNETIEYPALQEF